MHKILLALIATIGSAAPTNAQPALRQEVETLFAGMIAAMKSSPASVAQYYTDDAKILGGGQRTEGRQQVDAYWRSMSAVADWKLDLLEVGGDGSTPWVRGLSTLTGQSGRVSATEFVGLLKRERDGLKFYVDIYVAAAPLARSGPGAPPPD
jgi:ketosteroid isomerase-like protein